MRQTIPPQEVKPGELCVTYVNHSTVLLQTAGLTILMDPIWSDRASPFSFIGPRRYRSPGVRLEELPPIDLILLSHDHYDHLDLPTLEWLAAEYCPDFVVPLGVKKRLRKLKTAAIHELDWGDSFETSEAQVCAVPALHFSGRGPFDRNSTLWCGYVIRILGKTIYFAGDTACGEHFAQLRKIFGPPDLSLLPVGAYEPRWFMSPVHMSPDEAIQAHHVLESRISIGIHQGTFMLADDSLDTPKAILEASPVSDRFKLLRNGENIIVP